MEQTITIPNDDRIETQDLAAGEVIDAFDHVLESLDALIALTETAMFDGLEPARH